MYIFTQFVKSTTSGTRSFLSPINSVTKNTTMEKYITKAFKKSESPLAHSNPQQNAKCKQINADSSKDFTFCCPSKSVHCPIKING